MKNKGYIMSSFLCLIPVIIGLLLYNKLPDQMPIHWDINGEVNQYASKSFAILFPPIIVFFADLVTKFLIINSPKSDGYPKKLLSLYKYFLPLLSMLILILELISVYYSEIEIVSVVILVFVGIMFVVIGNYLPKTKQNYVIGIKIPWTLNDEENWNKTHRLGGYTFVIGGFVLMVIPFLPLSVAIMDSLLTIIIVMIIVIPMISSFILYKKKM